VKSEFSAAGCSASFQVFKAVFQVKISTVIHWGKKESRLQSCQASSLTTHITCVNYKLEVKRDSKERKEFQLQSWHASSHIPLVAVTWSFTITCDSRGKKEFRLQRYMPVLTVYLSLWCSVWGQMWFRKQFWLQSFHASSCLITSTEILNLNQEKKRKEMHRKV